MTTVFSTACDVEEVKSGKPSVYSMRPHGERLSVIYQQITMEGCMVVGRCGGETHLVPNLTVSSGKFQKRRCQAFGYFMSCLLTRWVLSIVCNSFQVKAAA